MSVRQKAELGAYAVAALGGGDHFPSLALGACGGAGPFNTTQDQCDIPVTNLTSPGFSTFPFTDHPIGRMNK